MFKLKKVFFLLLLFLTIFNFSYGQIADLIIKRSTESPKEGETVKLTLESSKYNLDNAKITWYIDGNEMDQGIGRKTFLVQITNQNPVQVITVTVVEEGLNDGQAQTVLEISGDILLYEGYNSSAPLFYKGRSLPGREGQVNLQLLSFKDGEITDFKPSQFTNTFYSWRVNDEEKPELSGKNKMQNIINLKVVDRIVGLEILKQDENSGKISKTNIPVQNQEILFYRQGDNGLTKNILKDTEIGKNVGVIVEPFFFSTANKYSQDLRWVWKINGLENSVTSPWHVSFSGDRNETVKIELNLTNTRKITQNLSKGFTYRVE